jgi:hypothetical protein
VVPPKKTSIPSPGRVDPTPGKDIARPKSWIPVIIEEGSQKDFGDESKRAISHNTKSMKIGCRSNKNRREEKVDRDKELRIQTLLDGNFKNDVQGG